MSFMFNRYPPPSKRAIFYAREVALHGGASEIDSTHLLCGLTMEETSRANTLFKLDERFPEETERARSLVRVESRDIPLSREAKRVLLRAADEANELDSYWIDTDHLVLGILRESGCAAAARIEASGLKITDAKTQIESHTVPRETYGPVPVLWQLSKPITRVGSIVGVFYLLTVVLLLMVLAGRGC